MTFSVSMFEISFFFFPSRHYPISTIPDLGFQPLLAKEKLIFVAIKISSHVNACGSDLGAVSRNSSTAEGE